MEEFLDNLFRSLERVEVRGRENLDIMLGCMIAIERMKSELNKTAGGEDDAEPQDDIG